MKKSNGYRIRFMVEGGSEFPFDMLRYDGCYPESSNDVALMLTTGKRKVTLILPVLPGYNAEVTTDRWNSFLWKVVHTEVLP